MSNPPFDPMANQPVPGVFINLGTGPVNDSNEPDGFNNMVKLCEDAGVLDQLRMPGAIELVGEGVQGRLDYKITLGERVCEVDMPAIPLTLVRWLGPQSGSIIDFPRLYVDGSSWVWKYAVNSVRRSLLGEGDPEE